MTFPVAGLISLEQDAAEALPLQICRQIRDAIGQSRIPADSRLPSTRRLAGELGVSRNTVLAAFEQLTVEGYLASRTGAGTFVAPVAHGMGAPDVGAPVEVDAGPRLSQRGQMIASIDRSERPGGRAFRPGIPDVRLFPHDAWARLLRASARQIERRYSGYGHYHGLPPLREAIARHLAETRGVVVTPDQILVLSSSQAALDLSARMLLDPGDAVGLEDPGYKGALIAFLAAGADIADLPVDDGGIDVTGFDDPEGLQMLYVTPSHQYPLGPTMNLERRLTVLDFARQANAYILEDDYDSEFHYRSRPIPALASLDDGGRVIYLGTFAKTMMPSIRVAFLALPKQLVAPFRTAQRNTGQAPSAVVQMALARFLDEGHFRAHVRRVSGIYRKRRDRLVALLAERCPGLSPDPVPDGGMQLAVSFDNQRVDDVAVSDELADREIDCLALSSLYRSHAGRRGLVLGFATPGEAEIDEGVDQLAAVYSRIEACTRG